MVESVDLQATPAAPGVTNREDITGHVPCDHDEKLNPVDRHEDVVDSFLFEEIPMEARVLHLGWELTVIPIDVLFVQSD